MARYRDVTQAVTEEDFLLAKRILESFDIIAITDFMVSPCPPASRRVPGR
jgi:hypothetical protein